MSYSGPQAPTGSAGIVDPGPGTLVNPLADGPTVLVSAVEAAEGARGAAAALACAGAELDRPALVIDVGGRAPRPTLLASAAAQRLEERLTAHLPEHRVAARGQICQLSVAAEAEGFAAAAAAATVARGAVVAVHLPGEFLQGAATGGVLRPSGVLLRAEMSEGRALVGLAVRGLMEAGLEVGVLKRRLSWVCERRALFGALPAGTPGGLSAPLLRRLLSRRGGVEAVDGGPQ